MALDHSCQVQRSPLKERLDDCYETPPEAVEALLRVERLPHYLWEPACGRGKIVDVLQRHGHSVCGTDLVDYGNNIARVDFLMESKRPALNIEAIITNPPFKLAEEFVEHALHLCPRVYMLLRLAFYESERRSRILDQPCAPRKIYAFRKRLPMMHRDGWEGRKANSGMAFAWFCWDLTDENLPTVIQRISWEDDRDTRGGGVAR